MTTLRAALATPLTGPLALYGKTCAAALTLWARQAPGLPAPWTSIELDVQDSNNNLPSIMQTMLEKRPDVVFGPYGSGPMLQAARVSQRVLWNHGGASSRLAKPTFPHVINVLSPASTYFARILQAIHAADPTARTVSLFHTTTGFGRDVAAGAIREATRLQMMIHPVAFTPSRPLEHISTVPDADILLVAGNFADERTVAPFLLARTWRFSAFVGAGVEEVFASLSALREGRIGPAQWVAHTALNPDEGPDARWFVAHYREAEGIDPPYAAAQAFAAGIVYARCLRDTGDADDDAIQKATQRLKCQTLFGVFELDPERGLQQGHQVVVVQWQKGQRRVVWPPEQAECPLIFSRSQ